MPRPTATTFQRDVPDRRPPTARPVRARVSIGLLLAVCGLTAVTAAPAGAAAGEPKVPPVSSPAVPDPAQAPAQTDIDPDAAAALAGQKGTTVAEARDRLAREQSSAARGAKIEKSLGGRSGGIYLDTDGSLVVTTLDSASDAAVTRGGARAQRVDDSSARLDAIMKQLDRQASVSGAGAVHGWYVDVPTNTVIVTVTEGASDPSTAAMTKLATSFGNSVRIEHRPADQAPRPAEWLLGGFEFRLPSGGTCSIGFAALDASNRNVELTAGHCVRPGQWFSRNGYWIGSTRTTNFPTDDFGTFWNSYPDYWRPSPSVFKYNGTAVRVVGQWNAPPQGATVCKSGRTTGYTCGTITGLNQTVRYNDGSVIYGLVRHNACVEPGDSGGANISAGAYALGVTSGASTSADRCLSKVGYPNVSWYQPVGEALSRNGLRLLL